MSDEAINVLIAEYEAWNKANGLNLGSADEHFFDEALTDEQRRWLRDFSERWEAADMSWFEREKRKRNLASGYKETKGLRGGHCNRAACQMPLTEPDGTLAPQSSMSDHEMFTSDGRLFYCLPCTRMFNDSDDSFREPRRCTMEPGT